MIKILDKIQLRYVIVGGVAVIVHGRPRTTTDLDLIVENDPAKIKKLFDELKTQEFEVLEEQVKLGLVKGANISVFVKNSLLRIDLTVAKKPDEIDALESAILTKFEDSHLNLASVDQVLYGKVLYLGDIEDVPEKELLEYNDVLDFLAIYLRNKSNLDWNLLKVKVARNNLEKTLLRLKKLADKIELF